MLTALKATLLLSALFATLAGTIDYRRIAIRRGIIAKMNARTLHDRAVPRGGGLVVGVVFSIAMVLAWRLEVITAQLLLPVAVGATISAIVGFVDDVYGLRPLLKLAIQGCLAVWLVATIYDPFVSRHLSDAGLVWRVGVIAALLFVPLWLINLYNFVDGIDGMAIIGAVFACSAAVLVLAITGGSPTFLFVFALLGMTCLGFLSLNLPPASVFMGDAGSIALGYCFSALVLITVSAGAMSVWTWIAIFSYFIADTTTTTVCRMLLVRRWYGEHRSHAYQNLARVTKSHAKVTYGVAGYHVLWALPLALWSAMSPHWGPAAVLSLAPAVVLTLRFGPRFSSD